MEKVFKEDEVVDLVDDSGKIVKGKIMEEADYNPATKRYLREVHPFIGIEKGKVKDPELREAYHNIRNHLDAMHNSDAASLNFFFRELTRVNINKAKKTDWLDFSRALDMMNGKTTDISFQLMADPPAGGTLAATLLNKPFIMWSNNAFNGGWSCDVYVTYSYTKIL